MNREYDGLGDAEESGIERRRRRGRDAGRERELATWGEMSALGAGGHGEDVGSDGELKRLDGEERGTSWVDKSTGTASA